ncbi:MAG TPA: ABC transporter ATP-binding protein [Chloroflexota bacterium]|nr:ABC transporter ATP-binding protein [Chloroflexota bacterium]
MIASADQPRLAFILAEDIGVAFGNQAALRGVSFDVSPGERILIRGANGAGKSTLIRVLAGLRRPDRGHVTILGRPPYDRDIRRQVGVVVHNPWLDLDLTALETLLFYGTLYGVVDVPGRSHAVLELVGMARCGDQRVGELSRGYQQRLTLARALLHQPTLLLLDEPDTGLDEDTLDHLASILLASDGKTAQTLIMTSHNRSFGQRIVDRTLTLERGALVEPLTVSTP